MKLSQITLPEKKSIQWLKLALIIFAVNFISIIVSRLIVKVPLNFANLFAALIIAAVIATLGAAGYIGLRVFSMIYQVFVGLAIFYMFYICIGKTSEGWSDLTSFIGYLVLVAIGFVIALMGEVVYRIWKSVKVQD